MKIALTAIFMTYVCFITFFTHVHIVNGVTIVHSHPFKSDANGDPLHEHTGAEIQLIHTLSTFFSTGLIVLLIILGVFGLKKKTQPLREYLFHPRLYSEGPSRLRPPPSFIG